MVRLGAGAFARVYKCIERATGIEYAVKIIDKSKLHRSHMDEQAIVREISILQRLADFRHVRCSTCYFQVSVRDLFLQKNIVALHEHFEEKDAICTLFCQLVCFGSPLYAPRPDFGARAGRRSVELYHSAWPIRYVTGLTLFCYSCLLCRPAEDQVRRMAAQICHAVAYVHSHGITHRDLKPENVMMTATSPPDCKVADFGLAKLVNNQTFLKTMCGTPAYLAPEVMLRTDVKQAYDCRVDTWSLGIIFYCM